MRALAFPLVRPAGIVLRGLGASALLLAPATSQAQCLLCTAPAPASNTSAAASGPERPLSVTITADLDFSRLIAGTGGGSATIDPQSGGAVAGNVEALGGSGFVGRVHVTGTPRATVQIDLPTSIDLVSSSGGSARVTHISTSLPPRAELDADGNLDFTFGGRLEIGGNASGDYRGRIDVTVRYD